VSLSSFSQTTVRTISNDTIVRITKDVAICIAQKLNERDKLIKDVDLLRKDTNTLVKVVSDQAYDIKIYKLKEQEYIEIISDKDKIDQNSQAIIRKQKKKLEWTKVKSTVSQFLLLGLAIFTISRL